MADTKKLMNLATLTYYDNKLKTWVATQIDGAIAELGNVFTLLGSKNSFAELPAEGNNVGDIWLVPTVMLLMNTTGLLKVSGNSWVQQLLTSVVV